MREPTEGSAEEVRGTRSEPLPGDALAAEEALLLAGVERGEDAAISAVEARLQDYAARGPRTAYDALGAAFERALLVPVRAGHTAAWEALYRQHEKRVLGFVRARVQNNADAEDIAQNTWLQVWKALPSFDPARGPFLPWARVLAHHEIAGFYRARRPPGGVVVIGDDTGVDVPEPLASDDDGPPPAVFMLLLRLTFASDYPPHQLLAFGFVKTGGWTPERMVAELADTPLRALEPRLAREYLAGSTLPPAGVTACLEPLRQRLAQPFSVAVQDPKTLDTFPHLRDTLVGDTTLSSYFTGERPDSNIEHWWYAVRRRVLKQLERLLQGQEQGALADPVVQDLLTDPLVREALDERLRRWVVRKAARTRAPRGAAGAG